jgi:hypothetical protein
MLTAQAAAEPDVRRVWGRRAGFAVAVASVVTVTATLLLATDPSAPPGYAGWTAVPAPVPADTASHDEIEMWSSKCSDLGIAGIGIQGVPARPKAAAEREVVVDRRGTFTFCVDISLGAGTQEEPFMALAGLLTSGGVSSAVSASTDQRIAAPTGADVLVVGGTYNQPEPPRESGVEPVDAQQIFGLCGADVTGVDIVLTNGLRVTASLRGGVWGAWWPRDRGDGAGAVLAVHTAAGTRTIVPATVTLSIKRVNPPRSPSPSGE